MPTLNFVLPHWLYWAGLLLFPLIAMYLVARQLRKPPPREPFLFIAYLFWLTRGIPRHAPLLPAQRCGASSSFRSSSASSTATPGARSARRRVAHVRGARAGAARGCRSAKPDDAGRATPEAARALRARTGRRRQAADRIRRGEGRLRHWVWHGRCGWRSCSRCCCCRRGADAGPRAPAQRARRGRRAARPPSRCRRRRRRAIGTREDPTLRHAHRASPTRSSG